MNATLTAEDLRILTPRELELLKTSNALANEAEAVNILRWHVRRQLAAETWRVLEALDMERADADAAAWLAANTPAVRWGRPGIPASIKRTVWERDHGRCVECRAGVDLEFDHVIPFSLGGSSTAANLQLLCAPCNRSKGAKL